MKKRLHWPPIDWPMVWARLCWITTLVLVAYISAACVTIKVPGDPTAWNQGPYTPEMGLVIYMTMTDDTVRSTIIPGFKSMSACEKYQAKIEAQYQQNPDIKSYAVSCIRLDEETAKWHTKLAPHVSHV